MFVQQNSENWVTTVRPTNQTKSDIDCTFGICANFNGAIWLRSPTYGSGECIGEEAWRMYWVHWNTLNARLARKSLAERRPATGRSMNPVRSGRTRERDRDRDRRPSDLRVMETSDWFAWFVFTFQEAGDVLQLRNVVRAVATMPL